MTAIGGYFGLELREGREYHENAIKLNTGRNALEYILVAKGYRKIYIPYYSCHVLLQPLIKIGINYEYYSVNNKLEPLFDYDKIKENECFLYTNYFGLKDAFLSSLKGPIRNLIVDNAQAFFSLPLPDTDTFYSARKFFGVPDGAYLYTDQPLAEELQIDRSSDRFAHLLIRTDEDAEKGFPYFKKNDEALDNNSIRRMSRLTQRILASIDYNRNKEIRKQNFIYIHRALAEKNLLSAKLHDGVVPMAYPYLSKGPQMRSHLIKSKIYVACYWPEVMNNTDNESIEHHFAQNLIPIPIDQRITTQDLDYIISKIKKNEH